MTGRVHLHALNTRGCMYTIINFAYVHTCMYMYILRNLKERLKEHQYAVKKENPKNGIAAHACQQHHEVNWDAAKVHCREQHYWKRKVLEAIHIWQQPNTSNLDCGFQINPVWLPHLKKP